MASIACAWLASLERGAGSEQAAIQVHVQGAAQQTALLLGI